MPKTAAALILTAGLATACMSKTEPSVATTATQTPASARLPPVSQTMSPPPFNPNRDVSPIPSATLPLAPPEIIGPPAPETMPMPR